MQRSTCDDITVTTTKLAVPILMSAEALEEKDPDHYFACNTPYHYYLASFTHSVRIEPPVVPKRIKSNASCRFLYVTPKAGFGGICVLVAIGMYECSSGMSGFYPLMTISTPICNCQY